MENAFIPSAITVVGAGKMGEAILAGWLKSTSPITKDLSPKSFTAVEPGEQRRQYLTDTYGINCVADITEAPDADIVVLSVKPQVMSDVLSRMMDDPHYYGGHQGPLFISIAAGISTASIEDQLDPKARVIRVMPNMGLQIGEGASALCAGAAVTGQDVGTAMELFSALGVCFEVKESDMDSIVALSGSGPAYVAKLIKDMTECAKEMGLDEELASVLAVQTARGTADLLIEKGTSAADLIASVCSPGGTTLAALDAMDEHGFDEAVYAGMKAARKRSEELGRC
ncbi:MAG: pyrroline-5-carboxylate reductase [Eggerthellaceae bacterium]|nr:pyrroline-5-carboxylate reductase [Eggerthellaceae bacterium]